MIFILAENRAFRASLETAKKQTVFQNTKVEVYSAQHGIMFLPIKYSLGGL
jgi:hypothetical protein